MVGVSLAVPLIGRERQLDRARRWLADLAEGRGRAALVEGEPGIGKSSLLRAIARDARDAGTQVFWASCDELSRTFPLLPLLEAVGAEAGRRSLVAAGSAGVAGLTRIAETLRTESAPGNMTDVVAAATERFLAFMDELCAARPVLLIVDDLQWADPATVIALGRLARAVRQLPLLVVAATRPVPRRADLIALRRTIAPDAQLPLHSLTGTESAELIAREVGGEPGARLMDLAEGAAGNPLYLTELVDALVRGGTLAIDDGRVETTDGVPPESLSAAIADRLEFLSTPVREVLRTAALLGEAFTVAELAAASARRTRELLPLLDEAMLAGVVLDNGAELAFRHPLIRSALYDVMPATVRAAWHRDAARALAEDGAPVEQVARQLLPAAEAFGGAGAVDDWMVRWLVESGQQLVGQAPHVAIPLLRWAVSGMPAGAEARDVLTCRLADALCRAGDTAAAAQIVNAALRLVTRPDLLVDLHWTLAPCRAREGRLTQTLGELRDALDGPGLAGRERARLLVLIARTQRTLGRLEDAAAVAEEALAEASEAGDRWATGWALGVLTAVYGMRGEGPRALALFDRALAAAEGDPSLVDLRLMLQINYAAQLGDLDRYDAAISAGEQVRKLADDSGNVARLAQAQVVVGELLYDVGRWDDALAEVDLGPGPVPDPSAECTAHGLAATIQFHRGELSAERHLAIAERCATRLGDRVLGSLVLARSLDREQADSPADALAVLMDGLSAEDGEIEEAADLMADAVRLAVSVGDRRAAHAVVSRADAVAGAAQAPHRKAVGPHCRGLLDHDPARLLEAADHYAAAGRVLPRAQALEAAARAFADRGDVAGARTRFGDAFSLYHELGAGWDLARMQAAFRAYGIRRGPRVSHRRVSHGWDSLTPTELKVADLVAQGMSNPQIAAHLFLSRRTVQTHVSHVLAKLALNSRIDIAREASRRGLRAGYPGGAGPDSV